MSSVLTEEVIKEKMMDILPIGDTDIFDTKFDMLIGGAIAKLSHEGVDLNATDKEGHPFFYYDVVNGENVVSFDGRDYILCLSYQMMKDMDYDIDMDFMTEQYITRMGTLRCYITMKQR